jgi:hypothetical protein
MVLGSTQNLNFKVGATSFCQFDVWPMAVSLVIKLLNDSIKQFNHFDKVELILVKL